MLSRQWAVFVRYLLNCWGSQREIFNTGSVYRRYNERYLAFEQQMLFLAVVWAYELCQALSLNSHFIGKATG